MKMSPLRKKWAIIAITISIPLLLSLHEVYLSTTNLLNLLDTQGEEIEIKPSVKSNEEREREKKKNINDGLWIGRYYDGDKVDPHTKDIHIVISHCSRNINWITDFTQGYNISSIHVISKCGIPVVDAPTGSTIEVLPNMGRNDHSYAHYIASVLNSKMIESNSDVENSIVVFLKDNIITHQDGLNPSNFDDLVTYSASSRGFSCLNVPKNLRTYSAYHNVTYLRSFKLGRYVSLTESKSKKQQFASRYENLGHMLDSLNIETQAIVQVCYGGNFAASVSNIERVNENVWSNVKNVLSRGDNIEEGHFIERSWGALLSTPLSQLEREILLNHSTSVFTDPCCYNGALLMN